MRIQIISDLHLKITQKKRINKLPYEYYLIWKQVMDIIQNDKPEILIINGDIIDNPQNLDLQLINFLNKLFIEITDVHNVKIILNTGNHDVLFTEEYTQDFGNFISFFKNNKKVFQVSKNQRINPINSLYINVIPFSIDVNNIYKFISKLNLNHGHHLFMFHQDFDQFESRLSIQNHNNQKVLNYDKIKKLLNQTGRYTLINGHYHKHLEVDDKLQSIGSLSQFSFKEKIKTIKDMDKYNGYLLFDYQDKDNYNVTFKTSNFKSVSIQYDGIEPFIKEFLELKKVITDNVKSKNFKIRIDDNFQNKQIIKDKINELRTFNNVELLFLPKKHEFTQDNRQLELDNENFNIGDFDFIKYFKSNIEKNIKDTDLIKRKTTILEQFDNVIKEQKN